jgi:hypothetical protein
VKNLKKVFPRTARWPVLQEQGQVQVRVLVLVRERVSV